MKNDKYIRYIIIAVVVAFAGYAIFIKNGSPIHFSTQSERMQELENRVVNDLADQYYMAKRSGSTMDAYIHAGAVRAACLQAKNEEGYKKWQEIENMEANLAGLPSK